MAFFDFARYDDDHEQHTAAYTHPRDGTHHGDYSFGNEHLFSSDSDMSSENGPQESEWDVLTAAQLDYFSIDPMQTSGMPLTPISQDDDPLDHFEELRPAIDDERWNVDRETAKSLSSVMSLTSPCEQLEYGLRSRFKDCKVDEPVLLTDPITDILQLYERNAVRVTTLGMKPFSLSKKKDERLTWDAKTSKLPDETDKILAAEKIVVDTETARLLKDIFEVMEGSAMERILRDLQVPKSAQALSPPLLPRSPPFSSEDLLVVAGQIPLTSTPEEPNLLEAAKLDAQIMEKHAPDKDGSDDMYGQIDLQSSSPLQRKIRKLDELKVSSPLLTLDSPEPPTKKAKTVAFSDDLTSFIPYQESDETSVDPYEAAGEVVAAVVDSVVPELDATIAEANDEGLIEIDTTMRVKVPNVNSITTPAPWEECAGNQRQLLNDTKSAFNKAEKQWSGINSLERELCWSAFPSRLGKPRPEDDFDDGSLARYMSELDIENDVDVTLIAPKQEGLRILDPHQDDEDELEPIFDNLGDDIISLPSRPISAMHPSAASALQTHEPISDPENTTGRLPIESVHVPSTFPPDIAATIEPLEFCSLDNLLKKRKAQLEQNTTTPAAADHPNMDDLESRGVENNTVGSLGQGHLSRFLTMQGIAPSTSKIAKSPAPTTTKAAAPSAQEQTATLSEEPPLAAPVFSKPPLDHDGSNLPVIISTTLLTNRPLIRSLQHDLPPIDLIERDYTTLHASTSATSMEADLTLSPSTGLVLTTLQKLKQKPLPGSRPDPKHPTLRSQIALQAQRYETLLVFITCSSASQLLSPRDAEVVADFTMYTNTSIPDTVVRVSLIPITPAETEHDVLAHWIAAAIVRYSPRLGPEMRILQDETLWERWLRRAGMNVFAAQVVLDAIKAEVREDVNGDSVMFDQGMRTGPVTGLAAFVLMSKEEMMRRFAAVMGGTRVLEKVSRAVDGPWQAHVSPNM